MHLYVKPPDGHVEVSAPVNLSDESIKLFIRTKMAGFGGSRRNLKTSPGKQPENMFPVRRCMYGADSIICWSTTAIREIP